jgi:hypothetical protein
VGYHLKALSNEITPTAPPQHFFLHEKISRQFFVKGVLFFGPGIKNKHLNKDLTMKIDKYCTFYVAVKIGGR